MVFIYPSCANPNDGTVEVEANGEGTSCYFSYNMFEFSGSAGEVYLHCKLQLCPKQQNNCIPVKKLSKHIYLHYF